MGIVNPSTSSGPAPRVLLVDDDLTCVRLYTDALLGEGYVVEHASDAGTAVDLARQHEHTVIVTNLALATAREGSLIQQLVQLQPEAKYLLISSTAQLDLPRMGAVDAKLVGVVKRSGQSAELIAAVQRVLRMRQTDGLRLPIEGRPTRILFLEDQVGDAQLVRMQLERVAGGQFELEWVERLQDGLRLLESKDYDVVLADLTLPDARGLDAVTQVKTAAPGVPIVIVSGMDESRFALHAVELGAQDFLSKGKIDGNGLLKSLKYAIERKRMERQFMRIAHYDALTGLANRVLFRDRLAHALARSRREGREFSVLYVDLDHFKSVNDGLGHEAGDTLLHQIGMRLRAIVRESDTVARLGGDEFAVLLETTSTRTETAKAASRILEAVARPVQLSGKDSP